MNGSSPTRPHFHAGPNNPGLVDGATATFATFHQASDYQIDEMYRHADCLAIGADVDDYTAEVQCPHVRVGVDGRLSFDDAGQPNPGELELDMVAGDLASLDTSDASEWAEAVAGRTYWISPCHAVECGVAVSEPAVPVRAQPDLITDQRILTAY